MSMKISTSEIGACLIGIGIGGFVDNLFVTQGHQHDLVLEGTLDKQSKLLQEGYVTRQQFEAAAQKGIDGLVAVASQQFPSTVNGLPVDTHALTRKAVEAYLAGDKSNPPVVKVPAVEKPAVPAP